MRPDKDNFRRGNRPDRREDRPARREDTPPAEENENQLEGRNALTEALRSGRTIDKVFIAAGDTDRAFKAANQAPPSLGFSRQEH